VGSIQVHPIEGLLVDWARSGLGSGKYPEQRRRVEVFRSRKK
jgi:hypothetical protein